MMGFTIADAFIGFGWLSIAIGIMIRAMYWG